MDKLVELIVDLLKKITGNSSLAIMLIILLIGSAYGGFYLYEKMVESITASNINTLKHIDEVQLRQLELELKVFKWERRSYDKNPPDYLNYRIDEWELAIERLKRKMRATNEN